MSRTSRWKQREERDGQLSVPNRAFSVQRMTVVLEYLVSGWPRRGRSLLVINSGSGHFLEMLWHSGFDITVQEECPALLSKARERIGCHAEYILAVPESIPRDEGSFDYVVACGVEYWPNPHEVFEEIQRLTCGGAIVLFANAFSLSLMHTLLQPKKHGTMAPWMLRRLLKAAYPESRRTWASAFSLFSSLKWRSRFGRIPLLLPLGSMAGVRVDFGRRPTGTPLLLRAGATLEARTDLESVRMRAHSDIHHNGWTGPDTSKDTPKQ